MKPKQRIGIIRACVDRLRCPSAHECPSAYGIGDHASQTFLTFRNNRRVYASEEGIETACGATVWYEKIKSNKEEQ